MGILFKSVTFLIPASNEITELRETIKGIKNNCEDDDIAKIKVIAKNNTCLAAFETKRIIEETQDSKIELIIQKAPTAVECFDEMLHYVESTHFIIMSADLETNPNDVRIMVKKAKENPKKIICSAKWHKDSVVDGYGILRQFGSRIVNKFVSVLFMKNIKDAFCIYQIYPVSVYNRLNFKSSKTALYEYTLLPLRLGVEYEEIPTVYKNRNEGKSNVNFKFMFEMARDFCLNAIRIRFTPKRKLIKPVSKQS